MTIWNRWLAAAARLPRRHAVALALAAGAAVFSPALAAGFFGDDFVLLATLDHRPACAARPFDLYRYSTGREADVAAQVGAGHFPWWTDARFRVALFRPLTSATLVLDRALFGGAPLGYHAHSLLWFLLAVAAVGLVLARAAPSPGLATLGTLLFAVDEAHWLSVSWVANRHALISTAFAFAGLWAHLRWREDRWRAGRWLALAGLAASLAAGESGVQLVCYLVAYEAVAARGPWRIRAGSLLPAAALVAVYLAVYHAAGYGAAAAGAYIDPAAEPGRFLRRAAAVAPAMVAELSAPTELAYFFHRPGPLAFWAITIAAAGVPALLFRRALAAAPPQARRRALWLVVGALLALVPPIASQRDPFGTSRSLMLPSVGAAMLLATVIAHGGRLVREGLRGRGAARAATVAGCAAVALASLVLEPLALPIVVGRYGDAQGAMLREAAALDLHEGQEVVLLNQASYLTGYGPLMARFATGHGPERWWSLSWTPHPLRLHRTGARTLEVETLAGGAFLEHDFEQFHRASDRPPPPVGQAVRTGPMTVEVIASGARGPTRLRVTFDRALEHPSLTLRAWTAAGLRAVAPPAVGAALDLPAPPPPPS